MSAIELRPRQFPGALQAEPKTLIREIWTVGTVLDKLAMLTVDTAVGFREQTIARQQEEMLELATPVVKLWDGSSSQRPANSRATRWSMAAAAR